MSQNYNSKKIKLDAYILLQSKVMFRWCRMYKKTWKDWIKLESAKFRKKHLDELVQP